MCCCSCFKFFFSRHLFSSPWFLSYFFDFTSFYAVLRISSIRSGKSNRILSIRFYYPMTHYLHNPRVFSLALHLSSFYATFALSLWHSSISDRDVPTCLILMLSHITWMWPIKRKLFFILLSIDDLCISRRSWSLTTKTFGFMYCFF